MIAIKMILKLSQDERKMLCQQCGMTCQKQQQQQQQLQQQQQQADAKTHA